MLGTKKTTALFVILLTVLFFSCGSKDVVIQKLAHDGLKEYCRTHNQAIIDYKMVKTEIKGDECTVMFSRELLKWHSELAIITINLKTGQVKSEQMYIMGM